MDLRPSPREEGLPSRWICNFVELSALTGISRSIQNDLFQQKGASTDEASVTNLDTFPLLEEALPLWLQQEAQNVMRKQKTATEDNRSGSSSVRLDPNVPDGCFRPFGCMLPTDAGSGDSFSSAFWDRPAAEIVFRHPSLLERLRPRLAGRPLRPLLRAVTWLGALQQTGLVGYSFFDERVRGIEQRLGNSWESLAATSPMKGLVLRMLTSLSEGPMAKWHEQDPGLQSIALQVMGLAYHLEGRHDKRLALASLLVCKGLKPFRHSYGGSSSTGLGQQTKFQAALMKIDTVKVLKGSAMDTAGRPGKTPPSSQVTFGRENFLDGVIIDIPALCRSSLELDELWTAAWGSEAFMAALEPRLQVTFPSDLWPHLQGLLGIDQGASATQIVQQLLATYKESLFTNLHMDDVFLLWDQLLICRQTQSEGGGPKTAVADALAGVMVCLLKAARASEMLGTTAVRDVFAAVEAPDSALLTPIPPPIKASPR